MIEYTTLDTIPESDIIEAFQNAFSDYAVSFTSEQLSSMFRRRGLVKTLSVGAFSGPRLIGIMLTGIGMYEGGRCAYDIGTGVCKDFRGTGISRRMFDNVLPRLKEMGIDRYILEVLTDNAPAISAYSQQGFKVSREFSCHRCDCSEVASVLTRVQGLVIESAEPLEMTGYSSFADFQPSWQNSDESVRRGADGLIAFQARINGITAGYIIGDTYQGDVTQLAVKPEFRRRGLAMQLVGKFIQHVETDFVKVLNIPIDTVPMQEFLRAVNIKESSRQYEMILSNMR